MDRPMDIISVVLNMRYHLYSCWHNLLNTACALLQRYRAVPEVAVAMATSSVPESESDSRSESDSLSGPESQEYGLSGSTRLFLGDVIKRLTDVVDNIWNQVFQLQHDVKELQRRSLTVRLQVPRSLTKAYRRRRINKAGDRASKNKWNLEDISI